VLEVAAEMEDKKRSFANMEGSFYSRRAAGVDVGSCTRPTGTGGDVVGQQRCLVLGRLTGGVWGRIKLTCHHCSPSGTTISILK
jgi:hypothetical protein